MKRSRGNNILWVGFCVPESMARELFLHDPSPAVQTHKFGWSFVRALKCFFGEVTLVSTCPVQSFPLVRQLVFRGGAFDSQEASGVLIGFINIIALKHVTRFMGCLSRVPVVLRRKRIDWIFIHGVHTPYLMFGFLCRLAGCSIAVVLTDPPSLVLSTDSKIGRLLKSIDSWLVKKIIRFSDAVVALAPDLAQHLAPDVPALVFPGILDSKTYDATEMFREQRNEVEVDEPFTIVYAGGLNAAYGVDRLLDAVAGLDRKVRVRLKLFGRGDQEDRVRKAAEYDSRFFYGGFVDEATLLPELCRADLLINPRPTDQVFASLSFPSKLIEYMCVGRPVLTTRIPSIPDSLKRHYYYIDDESVEGIGLAIQGVMRLPRSRRESHAQAAREFVLSELSEEAIGNRVCNFIEALSLNIKKS